MLFYIFFSFSTFFFLFAYSLGYKSNFFLIFTLNFVLRKSFFSKFSHHYAPLLYCDPNVYSTVYSTFPLTTNPTNRGKSYKSYYFYTYHDICNNPGGHTLLRQCKKTPRAARKFKKPLKNRQVKTIFFLIFAKVGYFTTRRAPLYPFFHFF